MKSLHSEAQLTIGPLAARAGLSVSAIRYYEEIGLIPPAMRRPSGHRVYSLEALQLLTLVKQCRNFGFSIEGIRQLVSVAAGEARDCREARDIAQVHQEAVKAKIAELRSLEHALGNLVTECTAQCAGGPASKCTIYRDLKESLTTTPPSARCCG